MRILDGKSVKFYKYLCNEWKFEGDEVFSMLEDEEQSDGSNDCEDYDDYHPFDDDDI